MKIGDYVKFTDKQYNPHGERIDKIVNIWKDGYGDTRYTIQEVNPPKGKQSSSFVTYKDKLEVIDKLNIKPQRSYKKISDEHWTNMKVWYEFLKESDRGREFDFIQSTHKNTDQDFAYCWGYQQALLDNKI